MSQVEGAALAEVADAAEPDAPPPARAAVVPGWLVAVVAVGGLAIRLWFLRGPMGDPDADEAVVGLMARSFVQGNAVTFFWGQFYGGTLEPALLAAVYAVTGTSTWALKALPITLAACSAVLVWRIGRRVAGEGVGRVAACLFWIFPPGFVFASVKERGFYWVAMVLGLLGVLLLLRLVERASVVDAALLGLVAGMGWWTSPHWAFLCVPVAAWALVAEPVRMLKLAPFGIPGLVIGMAPWLRTNLDKGGWPSFDQPHPPFASTYQDRLEGLVERLTPQLLGLRHLYSGDWVGSRPLALAAFLLLAAAVVVCGVRVALRGGRRSPVWALLAVLVAYPLLAAGSVTAYDVSETRVGLLVAPALVVLLALPLRTARAQVTGLVAACTLTLVVLVGLHDWADRHPETPDLVTPSLEPVIDLLDAEGVHGVFADYWIGYRIGLETDNRIEGSPVDVVREWGIHWRVAAEPQTTYVLYDWSPRVAALAAQLDARGATYRQVHAGSYVVFLLDEQILPAEVDVAFR